MEDWFCQEIYVCPGAVTLWVDDLDVYLLTFFTAFVSSAVFEATKTLYDSLRGRSTRVRRLRFAVIPFIALSFFPATAFGLLFAIRTVGIGLHYLGFA